MSHVLINRALRQDIPSNAVVLTKNEALAMQWSTINEWKPRSDTWPFNVGIAVLASVNAVTNLNIVQHFRNKLHLGNYGRITMALPTTAIPCLTSVFAHHQMVTNAILLGEECPLCVQTRAAALQVACGVAFPFITTPFAAFFYADSYGTYKVPPFKIKNIPQLVSLWFSMTKRLRSKLPMIIGANAIVAAALTYYEADSFYSIQSILYEREERFKKMMAEGIREQG